MGYWSMLSSVDDMEGRTLILPMSGVEAMEAVERAVARPNRVSSERADDGTLIVRTTRHTPAWAYLLVVPLLTIRKTRVAIVTFGRHERGTAVTVHGPLDTKAAWQLRRLADTGSVAPGH